jgi:AcrR family transcriptional regulator
MARVPAHSEIAPEADAVRARLLAAAGAEFARRGFEAASVRAICAAAEANVSAVKYYFGSKRGVYAAVWDQAVERTVSHRCMPKFEGGDQAAAEAALGRFVSWFVDLMLYQDVRATPSLGHLLSHEMLAPTPGGIDAFMERCCRPIHGQLQAIIRVLLGPGGDESQLVHLANRVIGLCVHPHQSREIHARMQNPVPEDRERLDALAADITRFALGGIAAMRG